MTGLRFARAARLLTGAVLAWHAGPWLAGAPPAMTAGYQAAARARRRLRR